MVHHLQDLLFERLLFLELLMAQKSLKSFSINSILRSGNQDEDEEKSLTEDGSDCESDLDVTGNDTPPLDCSQKTKETDLECDKSEFYALLSLYRYQITISSLLIINKYSVYRLLNSYLHNECGNLIFILEHASCGLNAEKLFTDEALCSTPLH